MQNVENGIIVIDKPPGITSAGVVAVVKRALGLKKVGHAGTLDPFATGILVCLLSRATRLARFLVAGVKTYEAELLLGVETDTEDLTGRVISQRPVDRVTEAAIRAAAELWLGEIEQQPPVYSALKHEGRPLYELAREGRPVQKPPRKVTISALTVLDVQLPRVRFRATCSPGTYIRTLGADIGRELGCGGHLTALRRTVSSGFSLSDAVTLSVFETAVREGARDRYILPMSAAMPDAPVFQADAQLAKDIRHGKPIPKSAAGPMATDGGGPIRVMTADRQLAAILLDTAGATDFEYGCVLLG
ncbi:MAG: tRNA pseudouridine(55) synthase TruB [Pseudomonadota bacterium]